MDNENNYDNSSKKENNYNTYDIDINSQNINNNFM